MTKISVNNESSFELSKKNTSFFIDNKEMGIEVSETADGSFKIFTSNKIYEVELVNKEGNEVSLSVDGKRINVSALNPMDELLKKLGMNSAGSNAVKEIKAPMPGSILSLTVQAGDSVKKGDSLLILEAMKMENVIKSPTDGVIKELKVTTGQNVEKNQFLISFE